MTLAPGLRDLVFRVLHGFRGVPVEIHGRPFRLDESLRRWETDAEAPVLKVIDEILRPGDTFVDVGANFGLHTLLGASKVGKGGQVIAIEPVPANIALLRKNIRLNGMTDRVRLVERAVTDKAGERLMLHGVADGVAVAATLRKSEATAASVEVATTTLDECLRGVEQHVRLVKIDVEGAEHLVIRGGLQLLRRYRPPLLIEVHEFALPDFGTSAEKLRVDLGEIGYRERMVDVVQGVEGRYFHALYES